MQTLPFPLPFRSRLVVGNLYHVDDRAGINAEGIFAGPAPNQGGGANDEDEFDFGSLLLDDDFLAQLEGGGGGGVTQDQQKPPPRSDGAPSPDQNQVRLRKIKGASQSSSLAAAAAAAGASGSLANGIGVPPSTSGVADTSQGRAAQIINNDDDDDDEAATLKAVDKGKARAVSPLPRRSGSPAPDIDSRRLLRDRIGTVDETMREEDLAAETHGEVQEQAQEAAREAGSRVPIQASSRPASSARPPTVVRPKAKGPISKKSQQGLFQRPNFDHQDGNDDEDEVDMLDEEDELPVAGPSKPVASKGKGKGRRKKAVVLPPPREEAEEEEEEDQLASSDPGAPTPPPAQARKARKAPRVDAASKSGGKAKKQQKVGKRGSARRDYTSSEEEEKGALLVLEQPLLVRGTFTHLATRNSRISVGAEGQAQSRFFCRIRIGGEGRGR